MLILYSRKGCCLCEGLEQKLRSLSLDDLYPSLDFCVLDIDDLETPKEVRTRYDLQVPVLSLGSLDLKQVFELPRVSPRLKGRGLFCWLQDARNKVLGSD